MEENWRVGTFWYTLALTSPTDLFTVFYKQIQPRFIKNYPEHDTFQQIMPWYWAQDGCERLRRSLSIDILAQTVTDRSPFLN